MAKMREYLPALGVLILFAIAGTLLFWKNPEASGGSGKVKVVASFYSMYDFAKNVGGDRVEVTMLIPTGVDVHEFEPSPSDIMRVSNADVFIYNGAGLEPWVSNLLQGIDNKNLTVVDTSKGIQLISSQDLDQPGSDPHIWLDPVNAEKQVMTIRDALIQADPAGKDYYESNAAAYIAKLAALDSQFRALMPTCRKKDILITHATLAYFCQEYGCHQIAITGINEAAEPSPADLVNVIQQAKADNVSVVFFEVLMNPKSAETVASEINGTVMVFHSLHGLTSEEQQSGEDYLSLMQGNLDKIKTALECG
jgi:zinc transport system substrate-binding protein